MVLANDVGEFFLNFLQNTGIYQFFSEGGWMNLIMILIAILLLYLAIFKKAEPYLLIPMGVGMLLANLPGTGIFESVEDLTPRRIAGHRLVFVPDSLRQLFEIGLCKLILQLFLPRRLYLYVHRLTFFCSMNLSSASSMASFGIAMPWAAAIAIGRE